MLVKTDYRLTIFTNKALKICLLESVCRKGAKLNISITLVIQMHQGIAQGCTKIYLATISFWEV
jgi:hypothetical protein